MSYKEYTVRVWGDGDVYWCNQKGQPHREDGPAVTHSDGEKEFFINGEYYSEEEYWEKLKPAKELTVAQLEKELGYKIKIIKEEK